MKAGRTGPFTYSPIVGRPRLEWPNGKRLAFWVIPNIETFALDEKMPEGGANIPNVFSWAKREYGNRVGVFRIMQVLSRYDIRATVALNSEVCDAAPAIIEEAMKLRWEFMGHGESNTRRLSDTKSIDEERALIGRTLSRIEMATGARPKGLARPRLAGNLEYPRPSFRIWPRLCLRLDDRRPAFRPGDQPTPNGIGSLRARYGRQDRY